MRILHAIQIFGALLNDVRRIHSLPGDTSAESLIAFMGNTYIGESQNDNVFFMTRSALFSHKKAPAWIPLADIIERGMLQHAPLNRTQPVASINARSLVPACVG